MATFFVVGASRGIGLSLVSEILAENSANKVVAGVRITDNKALKDIASTHPNRVTVVKIDVNDIDSVKEAADKISQVFPEGLDYLFHNAGVLGSETKYAGMIDTFNTSVLRVVDTFLPLVKKGNKKTFLIVSSTAGNYAFQPGLTEMAKVIGKKVYAYRVSKAALNFLNDILARDLAPDGIKILTTNPGYVDTDMAFELIGNNKDLGSMITPQASAKALLEYGLKATAENSGKFFDVNDNKVASLPL